MQAGFVVHPARCRSGANGTRRELIVKFVGQRLDCEEDSDEPTVLAKVKLLINCPPAM